MKDYSAQQNANILAFLTASEFAERRHVLKELCRRLAKAGVVWAVSCSAGLFFQGIVDDFNDLDILVDVKDVKKFEEVFSGIGQINHETQQKPCFSSPYYKEMVYGDTHFDIVGDFTVSTFNTKYCYSVKKTEIDHLNIEGDVNIPLAPIESSLLLYGMMEGWQSRRQFKRKLCAEYLREHGVGHPEVLKQALEKQELPFFLQKSAKELLEGGNK